MFSQMCENIRIELEKVDADADITEFVEKNQTGYTKPGSIQTNISPAVYMVFIHTINLHKF